ncbi:Kynurenine formamidase [Salinihabitans flavidus]|uniref:Kynurenine formamidase n=1 Tax=Salinihabitans flavidus TaxID=569882 RepID=A0A1H8PB81_9RHOB|nr:cyclase family protein [Salinihabitans flavidus]SEO39249.1 Kynurenine formamidase [Salinihabitans flavidus]
MAVVTKADVDKAFNELSNWGRWGDDDQLGTINLATPERVCEAAGLIKTGRIFGLGLSLKEPVQTGLYGGRWNPIHSMLATGTDVKCGIQEGTGLQYADDAINMPCQGSTQWDSIAHIFYQGKMFNGYDASNVTTTGARKNGIENYRDKMAGRGVLLDVARYKGVDWLEDGEGITIDDLEGTAKAQGVEIRQGDFVIFRTGHQKRCLDLAEWSGYAGGDAPGLAFETCYWIKEKDIAAICADTWGCEVRPNESEAEGLFQPWHAVVIPAIGIAMGEIFYLEELADDCAKDGVYEFFFTAPPLHLPGGCGSPLNPQAIK